MIFRNFKSSYVKSLFIDLDMREFFIPKLKYHCMNTVWALLFEKNGLKIFNRNLKYVHM